MIADIYKHNQEIQSMKSPRIIYAPLAGAFLAATALLTASEVEAASYWTTVIGTGRYGNNDLFVYLADEHPTGGCRSNARLQLPGSHPAADSVAAIAMAAYLSGNLVKLNNNGQCYREHMTLDQDTSTFFCMRTP